METPAKKAKMTPLASLCSQYPTMKERLKYEAMLGYAYGDPDEAEDALEKQGGHSQCQGDALKQVKEFYKRMQEDLMAAAKKDVQAAAVKRDDTVET